MKKDKYYDWDRCISLETGNGCSLDRWSESVEHYSFAVHACGFLVFLPPSELDSSNEYAEGDPYGVETGINQAFHKRRFDMTLELLHSIMDKQTTARLLDVGCGQGHITTRIHNEFPCLDVSGLDYSISAINSAIEKYPDIDFVVADAHKLPYHESYFDVVICNNLWEHVPSPLALLREFKKVLKPEGYLIISTPSRYRLPNLLRVMIGKPIVFMSDLHVTEYSVGQVIEQLRYGKFETLRISSRRIAEGQNGLKHTLVLPLIRTLVELYLRFFDSHHLLDSTIFILAKNSK